MLALADIQRAAKAIAPAVRRTPLMAAGPLQQALPGRLSLKLESLQVTGSFKARGASNGLAALDGAKRERGLVTASGGNHGAAVAYAGWQADRPSIVVVPGNVDPLKVEKIRSWGARVIVEGDAWAECDRLARRIAEEDGRHYLHPFADETVIAGQGTVALEILEDDPSVDTLLIAVGGAGLIAGMATAAKAIRPGIRIVGVEPTGCPTLKAALEAGGPVQLERIDTIVPTMAAPATAQVNYDLCKDAVDDIVLVSDEAMAEAARMLWMELGLAVDLSGAAAIAALMTGAWHPKQDENVCALVCGAGTAGIEG